MIVPVRAVASKMDRWMDGCRQVVGAVEVRIAEPMCLTSSPVEEPHSIFSLVAEEEEVVEVLRSTSLLVAVEAEAEVGLVAPSYWPAVASAMAAVADVGVMTTMSIYQAAEATIAVQRQQHASNSSAWAQQPRRTVTPSSAPKQMTATRNGWNQREAMASLESSGRFSGANDQRLLLLSPR